MLGWGNSGCLDCTAPALASLQSCTGIPAVKATPCVEFAALSCSAAQQAATLEISVSDLSDDSDRCGHTTLALTGISPDKFTGLAGAALVAVTAQLRHWPRCHHAQVSQPPKQLLALSPLPSHALLRSRLLSSRCPPVTSVMIAAGVAIRAERPRAAAGGAGECGGGAARTLRSPEAWPSSSLGRAHGQPPELLGRSLREPRGGTWRSTRDAFGNS